MDEDYLLKVLLGIRCDCPDYVGHDLDLPTPSPYQEGQELLTVQPVVAAQLDLYAAMREQKLARQSWRRVWISARTTQPRSSTWTSVRP